jgi:hypothetical protein
VKTKLHNIKVTIRPAINNISAPSYKTLNYYWRNENTYWTYNMSTTQLI